jgi:hypothetical protein
VNEARPPQSSREGTRPTRSGRGRRALLWGLKIGGTLAGFAYIATLVRPAELATAMTRASAAAFIAACGLVTLNLGVGALRWRALLSAYGAPRSPSLFALFRAYAVGFFYNCYLPGGVGGDVVRGVVTRASFGERGTTASMTVVLVERVLGLSGLLVLVSATTLVRPLPGTETVLPFSALFLLAAAGGVLAIALGRRAAPHLPTRIASVAGSLPELQRGAPFALALAISLATQTLVALTGWVLMASVTSGRVGVSDALVLVPLASATAYFPLSVGGAGAREAAFVALGVGTLGMSEADALACSLLMWLSQLAVGALGGLWQLLAPLGEGAEA